MLPDALTHYACKQVFRRSGVQSHPVFTSAEVLQEMFHAYLSPVRLHTLDAAMTLVRRCGAEVCHLELEDVTLARQLHERRPTLSARDLCHLASCHRRGVSEIKTFDQAFQAVVC